ncbi:MAG TPA: TetR/AcrR family transcriptional regulator [Actinomycetota bacterium]|jgi:AcrR family transcriptional regulator
MSPRGVTIPDVPEQLFRAAERVLLRAGPSGLSSRAITSEAGVAKGILHNHFTDLDGFLAAFVLDRFQLIAEDAAKLPSRAGAGTVVGNLTDAALSVFGPNALAIISLVLSRPALMLRLQQPVAAGAANLQTIEATFAAYLDAEKQLGRIAADADTETLALTLLGTVHHLFLTGQAGGPDLHSRVRRIAAVLVAAVAPSRPAPQ